LQAPCGSLYEMVILLSAGDVATVKLSAWMSGEGN
jgi:hypothetical protein